MFVLESVMGGEERDGVTEGMDLNTTFPPDLFDNSSMLQVNVFYYALIIIPN
jgi:hypothetical protein